MRLTLAWQLQTPAGLQKVLDLVKRTDDVDLWGSLPCTVWCTWQHINLKKFGKGFAQTLAHRRAEARQLIVHFCLVARAVHAKQGDVTVEWPRNCLGGKIKH